MKSNHQLPPVSEQDILDGGCTIEKLPEGTFPYDPHIYNSKGQFVGKFEDVEWGYGASSLLIIDHVPITERPVPSRSKT